MGCVILCWRTLVMQHWKCCWNYIIKYGMRGSYLKHGSRQ
uniref:Uncharacterized protein n=1 Tax=Anguilla anguilla TaxID=7936 RepID=A0A0E9VR94_ANGAN